jgi:hypothetical protein
MGQRQGRHRGNLPIAQRRVGPRSRGPVGESSYRVIGGMDRSLGEAVADGEGGCGGPVIDADLAVDAREMVDDGLLAQ